MLSAVVDGETVPLALTLALAVRDAVAAALREADADGDAARLRESDGEADSLRESDSEAVTLRVMAAVTEALRVTDGDTDCDAAMLRVTVGEALVEALMLRERLRLALCVDDSVTDAARERVSDGVLLREREVVAELLSEREAVAEPLRERVADADAEALTDCARDTGAGRNSSTSKIMRRCSCGRAIVRGLPPSIARAGAHGSERFRCPQLRFFNLLFLFFVCVHYR